MDKPDGQPDAVQIEGRANDMAFIGCRLLALFFVFSAVERVFLYGQTVVMTQGSPIAAMPGMPSKTFQLGYHIQAILAGIGFLAAYALWAGAGLIARRIHEDKKGPPLSDVPMRPDGLFVAIGIFLLAWCVPDFLGCLVLLDSLSEEDLSIHALDLKIRTAVAACKALLGLALVIGHRALVGLLGRMRKGLTE